MMKSKFSNKRYRSSKAIKDNRFSLVILFVFIYVGIPADAWSLSDNLVKGEACFINGELLQAAEHLERAIEEMPNDPRALSDLGRTYFHMGDYPRAEYLIKSALAENPTEEWLKCWSVLYLGKIYTLNHQWDHAYRYLGSIKIDRTTPCILEASKYRAYLKVIQYAEEILKQTHQTQDVTIHYAGLEETDVSRMATDFSNDIDDILKLFRLDKIMPKIQVYIYREEGWIDDLWDAREVLARYRSEEIHMAYENIGYMKHEMVHILLSGSTDSQNLDPLLNEGAAEYAVGSPWGKPLDKWVKSFIRDGNYVRLAELRDARRFRQINPIIAYEEAGSFVKFIIENYGIDNFKALLQRRKKLEALCSKPIDVIEKDWLAAVDRTDLSEQDVELIRYRVKIGESIHNRLPHQKESSECYGYRPE